MVKKVLIGGIFVIILVAISYFAYTYINQEEIDYTPEVKSAVSNQLGLEEVDVTNVTKTHARALSGDNNIFLTNFDSGWRVVLATSGEIYCEQVEALGFPQTFISDCELKNITLSGIGDLTDRIRGGEDITGQGYQVTVYIPEIKNTECNCFEVEYDGETITIYGGDTDVSDLNGTTTIDVIVDEDDDIVVSTGGGGGNNNDDDDGDYLDDDPSGGTTFNEVLEYIDINRSGQIQLISD